MSNRISHSGIIKSIGEGCIKVQIVQTSACAACKVSSHCNAAESKVKIVDVFGADVAGYQEGQQVVVWASKDVANRALLLGFGLPLLLLVVVLLATLHVTSHEGKAALAALLALVPYYGLLYLFRNSIRQKLSFYLE